MGEIEEEKRACNQFENQANNQHLFHQKMPSTFLGMAPTFTTTTYFIMEALALLSIKLIRHRVSTSDLDRWLIRDAPHITTAVKSVKVWQILQKCVNNIV